MLLTIYYFIMNSNYMIENYKILRIKLIFNNYQRNNKRIKKQFIKLSKKIKSSVNNNKLLQTKNSIQMSNYQK